MQSFLSKLKQALPLISTVKEILRQASISKIKADSAILFQFLDKSKYSIKLIAEVRICPG